MRGLLEKIWWESRALGVGACATLALVVTLLTLVLPPMQAGIQQFTVQLPGLKGALSGLLGVAVMERVSLSMLLGVVWVDPVVLAVVMGFIVYFCTRFPAAEVERGTIDILLSWPVSRTQIFFAETAAGCFWGIALVGSGWLGFLLGSLWLDTSAGPVVERSWLVAVNLLALSAAVAGMTFWLSARSERRGRASLVALSVLAASYLLHFLSSLWQPASVLDGMSFFHYYQPGKILLSGLLPVHDCLMLAGFALVSWALAWRELCKRDLCTG